MLLIALAATATFDPLRFFSGRTEGTGRLRVVMHRPRTVHVHGSGEPSGDGIALAQTVEQAGRPATQRRWFLHRVGQGRYVGSLTDAVGPVTADAQGDRLHIAYRGKGGLRFEQWLVIAPDGRSATNRLTARKIGIVVARLDETIRRVD